MRGIRAWLACALVAGAAFADDDKEAKKAQAYLKVGLSRLEAGKPKEALAAFKRGLEHKPLPELHLGAGRASDGLGDREAAAREWRAYLAAVPDAPERDELERLMGGGAPSPSAKKKPEPARAPTEKCAEGQFVTPGTSGHCCWREQVWSDDREMCVGIPRCPPGMMVDDMDCVPMPRCPAGKVPAGAHCCWPAQTWSDEKGRCAGAPKCPRNWVRDGNDCAPPEEEDEG